ncbi:MAG TPA: lysylphosphatidylglycerol synthase transmembrane domain-containing protein, partial [Kiloniellales bacterium]|nr:lysylphosphatidylglycerol synthase transmembrane domain-containing protein [Kiloniellales bacterium]
PRMPESAGPDATAAAGTSRRGGGRRGLVLGLAKVAVSALLLGLLVANLDLGQVRATLAALAPAGALAAVAVLILHYAVLGLRWSLVMDRIGAPLGFLRVLPMMFVGMFFNQVLPTTYGGDAMRIWQAHRAGADAESAVVGVLLERLTGVLGLVVLVVFGVAVLGDALVPAALRWVLLAALPAALAGLAVIALLDRLPERWQRWRIVAGLARLAAETRRLCLSAQSAALLLLLALASHALQALSVYALARGLGLPLSALECVAIFPIVILATLLPISFAGWGLREGATVYLLGLLGIGAGPALALSLLSGLVLLATSLPGLAIWLAGRRAGVRRS